MITLSIDTNVDAAYIELTDEPIVKTIEVTPNVQVDIDATGTVVGVELLSLTAELPIDALDRFVFPPSTDAQGLSRVWPSISYASEGQQGQAYVPPVLQPA
ncbi:MAG: DUF2283 domain-containing protein [Mycobacterium sp.]|uniref:DUF2283 domain-containing protein n=1 Tax=Mycobacterium sp. TaxID=1785 RepID=UPI003F99B3B6